MVVKKKNLENIPKEKNNVFLLAILNAPGGCWGTKD